MTIKECLSKPNAIKPDGSAEVYRTVLCKDCDNKDCEVCSGLGRYKVVLHLTKECVDSIIGA